MYFAVLLFNEPATTDNHTMLSLTVCSALVALVSTGVSGCTTNWVAYGDNCYFMSHDTESWADAMAVCKLLGGNLAEIDDSAEGMFLSNLTHGDKNNHRAGFWVGLSDIEIEGTYMWMNSKTLYTAASYSNWAQGEPDNGNGVQNCVFLHGNDVGKWYTSHCAGIKNYFCEKVSGEGAIIG